MNRKWDKAPEEINRKCLNEVIARVEDVDTEEVGVIAAQDIIDIVLENLAPFIYDAGVDDARRLAEQKQADLDTELALLRQSS